MTAPAGSFTAIMEAMGQAAEALVTAFAQTMEAAIQGVSDAAVILGAQAGLGVPLLPSEAVARGAAIIDRSDPEGRRVLMHPLDIITLMHRNPHDRIDAMTAYVKDRAEDAARDAIRRIDGMYRDAP